MDQRGGGGDGDQQGASTSTYVISTDSITQTNTTDLSGAVAKVFVRVKGGAQNPIAPPVIGKRRSSKAKPSQPPRERCVKKLPNSSPPHSYRPHNRQAFELIKSKGRSKLSIPDYSDRSDFEDTPVIARNRRRPKPLPLTFSDTSGGEDTTTATAQPRNSTPVGSVVDSSNQGQTKPRGVRRHAGVLYQDAQGISDIDSDLASDNEDSQTKQIPTVPHATHPPPAQTSPPAQSASQTAPPQSTPQTPPINYGQKLTALQQEVERLRRLIPQRHPIDSEQVSAVTILGGEPHYTVPLLQVEETLGHPQATHSASDCQAPNNDDSWVLEDVIQQLDEMNPGCSQAGGDLLCQYFENSQQPEASLDTQTAPLLQTLGTENPQNFLVQTQPAPADTPRNITACICIDNANGIGHDGEEWVEEMECGQVFTDEGVDWKYTKYNQQPTTPIDLHTSLEPHSLTKEQPRDRSTRPQPNPTHSPQLSQSTHTHRPQQPQPGHTANPQPPHSTIATSPQLPQTTPTTSHQPPQSPHAPSPQQTQPAPVPSTQQPFEYICIESSEDEGGVMEVETEMARARPSVITRNRVGLTAKAASAVQVQQIMAPRVSAVATVGFNTPEALGAVFKAPQPASEPRRSRKRQHSGESDGDETGCSDAKRPRSGALENVSTPRQNGGGKGGFKKACLTQSNCKQQKAAESGKAEETGAAVREQRHLITNLNDAIDYVSRLNVTAGDRYMFQHMSVLTASMLRRVKESREAWSSLEAREQLTAQEPQSQQTLPNNQPSPQSSIQPGSPSNNGYTHFVLIHPPPTQQPALVAGNDGDARYPVSDDHDTPPPMVEGDTEGGQGSA